MAFSYTASATGGTFHAQIMAATPFAVALTAGSGLAARLFTASDAAILSAAGGTLAAGSYRVLVCTGSAGSASNSSTFVESAVLEWTGTAVRSLLFSTAGYIQVDVINVNAVAASSLLANVTAVKAKTDLLSFSVVDSTQCIKSDMTAISGYDIDDGGGMAANFQAFFSCGDLSVTSFDLSTVKLNLDAKVSEAGIGQQRTNDPAAPAYTLRASRRSDGTYKFDKPIRIRPGSVGNIAVQLDLSPVYGTINVATVGTPTVSGGSITCTALGPRDQSAMVKLTGTATASESRTVSVTVTMATGESERWTFDVVVFAD